MPFEHKESARSDDGAVRLKYKADMVRSGKHLSGMLGTTSDEEDIP